MAFIGTLKRRLLGRSHDGRFEVSQPKVELGRVVFTGFGPGRFASGKVRPKSFFPPFCSVLAEHGIRSYFVEKPEDLNETVTDNTAIIHVYREATDADMLHDVPIPPRTRQVYNDAATGMLIAHKPTTNRLYTKYGVPIPELVEEGGSAVVFSNEVQAAGAQVRLLGPGDHLDPTRYNTKFVDTRVTYKGKEFFTTVRLLCVGPDILHALVRARPVSDGSASVHARDTPVDADLVEHLQRTLVEPHRSRFDRIASQIHGILGPGFYSHDLLIERETEEIFVCESGFKFEAPDYVERFGPIADSLPSHHILFGDTFARLSASVFVSQAFGSTDRDAVEQKATSPTPTPA